MTFWLFDAWYGRTLLYIFCVPALVVYLITCVMVGRDYLNVLGEHE